MKKMVALVLLAVLALSRMPSVLAEAYDGDSALFYVIDFKFHHYEKGIGYGSLPVYTAPSLDAVRAANGKAAVDTNADMYIGGFDESGWLMVRYETNNKGIRVGYVEPGKVKGFKTDIDPLKFSRIPQVAQGQIELTDDPMKKSAPFAVLEEGTPYYILGKYTYYGNWWYIECTVNDQAARGFIDRNTTPVDKGDGVYTTELGVPPRSPQGEKQIGTVTVVGDAKIVRQKAGTEYEMVARVGNNEKYAAYAAKTGTNGSPWYYIYVDGVWGWIAGGSVRFE